MKRRMALILGVMALAMMAPGVAQAEMQEPHFKATAGPVPMITPKVGIDMQLYAEASCGKTWSTATMPLETKAVDLWYGPAEDCEVYGYEGSVDLNHCGLTLSVENVGPPYKGAAGIHCSKAGEAIELTDVWGLCNVKVYPQAGVAGSVDYENVGSGVGGSFNADVHMTKIKYTTVDSSIWCPAPKGTWSDGTLSTEFNLRAGPEYGVSLKGEKV